MFCSKCGNEIDDDAVFCAKCGFKIDYFVEDSSTVKNTKLNSSSVKNLHTAKREMKILAIVLAVALVFSGVIVSRVSTPEKTIKKAFNCINRNDIEGLLDCCSPEIQSSVRMVLGFTSILGFGMDEAKALSSLADSPNLKYEIVEITYTGKDYDKSKHKSDFIGAVFAENAEVTFIQSRSGEDEQTFTVDLENYNGKWLITDDSFLRF